MPKGNKSKQGSGPVGQGQGAKGDMRSGGSGKGHMGGTRPGAGPGGNCICPQCGKKAPHQQGNPCYSTICPQCGSKMMRE